MLIAAIVGLLLPALDEGSAAGVAVGFAAGVAFLLVARHFLEVAPPAAIGDGDRTWVLVFLVLFVHSLPEGFAIGTAYASTTEGLGLFIVVAIAIQNVPEGTSTAIPMATAGFGCWAQFWAAIGSSIPQPIGAVIAFLLVERSTALLPLSFAFAAGAMLALVVVSVFPDALRAQRRDAYPRSRARRCFHGRLQRRARGLIARSSQPLHIAKVVAMDDAELRNRIEELVAEERRLSPSRSAAGPDDERHQRLQEVKVELDQCWDLLRQREAHEEFKLDPDDTSVRDAETVEGYEQ